MKGKSKLRSVLALTLATVMTVGTVFTGNPVSTYFSDTTVKADNEKKDIVNNDTSLSDLPDKHGVVTFADNDNLNVSFEDSKDGRLVAEWGSKVYFRLNTSEKYDVNVVELYGTKVNIKKAKDVKKDDSLSVLEDVKVYRNDGDTTLYYFEMPKMCRVVVRPIVVEAEQLDIVNIKENDNKFISTPDYILKNIDKDYVNVDGIKSSDLEAVDALLIKQTIADKSKLPKKDLTADGLWSDKTDLEAFLGQHEVYVPMYDIDKNSDYYVSFINHNIGSKYLTLGDVKFAYNNNYAEMIDDAIYDDQTGIAYIPKKYTKEDKNGLGCMNIQTQLLQLSENADAKSEVDFNVSVKNVQGDVAESGTAVFDSVFDNMLITLAKDEKAIESLMDAKISVNVDGVDLTDNFYDYDKATGILTFHEYSAYTSSNIVITITGKEEKKSSVFGTILDTIFPSTDVNAGTITTSWKEIKANSVTDKRWKLSTAPKAGAFITIKRATLHYGSSVGTGEGGNDSVYTYNGDNATKREPWLDGSSNAWDTQREFAAAIIGTHNKNIKDDDYWYKWDAEDDYTDQVNFYFTLKGKYKDDDGVYYLIPKSNYALRCAHINHSVVGGELNDGNKEYNTNGKFSATMYARVLHVSTDSDTKGTIFVGFVSKDSFGGQTAVGMMAIPYEDEPDGGSIELQKYIQNPTQSYILEDSSLYSTENAEFKFTYVKDADGKAASNSDKSKNSFTIKTDDEGYFFKDAIELGTYELTETKAPKGCNVAEEYIVNGSTKKGKTIEVVVTSGKKNHIEIDVSDPVKLGSLTLSKVSSNPNFVQNNSEYSFEGAKYVAYGPFEDEALTKFCGIVGGPTASAGLLGLGGGEINSYLSGLGFNHPSGCYYEFDAKGNIKQQLSVVPKPKENSWEWKVGAVSNFKNNKIDNLPYGWYAVKEIEAPDCGSYALDTTIHKVHIDDNNQNGDVTFSPNEPERYNPVGVLLRKRSGETNDVNPQGDGSLAGAVFHIAVYDKKNSKDSIKAGNVQSLFEFDATTILDDKKIAVIDLTQGKSPISNFVSHSGTTLETLYRQGNGKIAFPISWVAVSEKSAPTGYLVENNLMIDIHKGDAGNGKDNLVIFDAEISSVKNQASATVLDCIDTFSTMEYEQRGGVQVQKWNKELKKSESLAGANHGDNTEGTHLDGVEFNIYNVSKETVKYMFGKDDYLRIDKNGNRSHVSNKNDATDLPTYADSFDFDNKKWKDGAKPVAIDTIISHWNEDEKAYTAETYERALIYGTYVVQEVKTHDSYLLTDGSPRVIEVRENGVIVKDDVDKKDLIYENQVVRGDIHFNKILDSISGRLSTLFVIKNDTSGERHVIATDRNGEYNSASKNAENTGILHSKNTNGVYKKGNETDLLAKIDAGKMISMSDINTNCGTWFGLGEDGSMAPVKDDLGALPYGQYTISEVRTDTNTSKGDGGLLEETYTLQEFNVWVFRDKAIVDLGTVTDDSISISTEALDAKTKEHIALAEELVTINEEASYEGVKKGSKYVMKGTLMDATDKVPVKDKDGNNVTAEKEFTAKSGSGSVKMAFTFNAKEYEGHTIVVFEELYDSKGNVVATEKDFGEEEQSVQLPKIGTTATSDVTGEHDAPALEKLRITDKVSYENLIPGKTYTMTGTLFDKETFDNVLDKDGKEIISTAEFTPSEPNGTVEIVFEFDASALAGKSVVAFETCEYDGHKVGVHADINDEDQTVHIPKIGTTAKFDETGDNEGIAKNDVIITDTVSYENLLVGVPYTVNGTLMDKTTGEPVKNDGKEVTSSVDFIPSETSGTVEVVFHFDASELAGHDTVVFETLVKNDIEMAWHKDMDDEGQTIHFPEIGTKFTDKDTGIHEVPSAETKTIVDTVSYKNLTIGNEYTMTGTLMNKKTGEPLLDADGTAITASKTFKAEAKDGIIDLEFTINTSILQGESVVAFESLTRKEIEVAVHADLQDADQTIVIPKIGTLAAQKDTGLKVINPDGTVTIVDTVAYEKLIIGNKYKLLGTLMDKKTGEPLVDKDGNKIVTSVEFTAGNNQVVEEETTTAAPEEQTTDVAPAETESTSNPETTTEAETSSDVKVPNTKDLDVKEPETTIPSEETTKAGLTDEQKQTVKKVLDEAIATADKIDWSDVEAVKAWVKGYQDEINIVNFEPDVFAIILNDMNTLNEYTTALVGDKVNDAELIQKVVDMLKTIRTKLGLDDKNGESNEVVIPDTLSTSGTVEVEFTFDASLLDGTDVVVFEELYAQKDDVGEDEKTETKEYLIAEHKDINDEGQTVHFPSLHTNAVDKTTKTHQLLASDKTVVVDTITYSNLIPGIEYSVTGTLMDKSTGKVVDDIKPVTVTFTPEKSDGTVDVEFTVDAVKLQGKSLVAFEQLMLNGNIVGTHEDINDDDQTVSSLKIGTLATGKDGKSKEISIGKSVTIIDTVSYEGLTPGNEYIISGVFMNKSTNKAVKGATGDVKFTPKKSSGTVKVKFTVDTSKLENTTLVAFETVTDSNKNEIGSHKDINDKDQSVVVKKAPKTPSGKTKVQTGVQNNAWMFVGLAIVLILGAVGVTTYVVKRKRKVTGKVQ